jgi:hypothetical protein
VTVPHAPGADAAAWAVASQLATHLNIRFQLIEGHPGGGQSDLLWFVNPDKSIWPQDQVMLAVHGTGFIRVLRADGTTTDGIGGYDVWQDLAAGRVGVRDIVHQTVEAVGDLASPPPSIPRPSDQVYATIAAVLARAALFGLRWTCLWGVDDNSGSYSMKDDRAYLFVPYLADLPDVGVRDEETYGEPGRYWFLLDEQGQPLAAFDIQGALHLPTPAGGDATVVELAGPSTALPAQVADDVFTPLIRTALHHKALEGAPTHSELGLPAMLAAFNRKERLFLLGYASGGLDTVELHAPGLHLGEDFRTALATTIGVPVPAHAWAGTDYHLSWLHAALQWHQGITWPGQLGDFPLATDPSGEGLVTGTQQDADLVVAWADATTTRVVLIEAKGYGAWDNAQATAKLARIGAIRDAAGSGVDIRFVLTSPRRHTKLDVPSWPSWALTPDGQPFWLRLPTPSLRLKTERCDPEGRTTSGDEYWKIVGPTT